MTGRAHETISAPEDAAESRASAALGSAAPAEQAHSVGTPAVAPSDPPSSSGPPRRGDPPERPAADPGPPPPSRADGAPAHSAGLGGASHGSLGQPDQRGEPGVPAQPWTSGRWNGLEQWRCTRCAWDTLEGEAAFLAHWEAVHLAPPAPRSSPLVITDRFGNVRSE